MTAQDAPSAEGPSGRPRCGGRPEEVAYAALYLASEVSAHTTGMPLHLDSIVMG